MKDFNFQDDNRMKTPILPGLPKEYEKESGH